MKPHHHYPRSSALIAGAASVFAFAPFGFWPIQFFTLALLFDLLHYSALQPGNAVKRNALLGWAFGFAWSACGTYWLFISMHRYGGMPAPLAALAVALLALLLGGFGAICIGAVTWLRQRWQASSTTLLLLLLPAAWTLSEWLRNWMFSGFPWLVSGFAHSDGWLAGYAPLAGVFGIGLVVALIAACLALVPQKKSAALLAIGLLLGGAALRQIEWTQPSGAPLSVRLLQANVPQEIKFAPEQVSDTLRLYDALIRQAPADLIATPETAFPVFIDQIPLEYWRGLAHYARASDSVLALGVAISDAPGVYGNSVVALGLAQQPSHSMQDAAFAYRYNKYHLVPFGEFVPLGFRWFVDLMQIPLGDQTRGAVLQAPFPVRDQWVLPNICYEDLFGNEIASRIGAAYFSDAPQPTLLLNVSNIAWFGDSIVVGQHLQISQMRALETGRPMLRATNSGATAVIDTHGRVVQQLAPFTRGTLSALVQGYRGVTPYVLFGNALVVTLIGLMLALAWYRRPANAARR